MGQIFHTLQPWLPYILHTIKKEIKHEHLAKSPAFYKMHFGNRSLNRLTNEEISTVYEKELLQGNQVFAEWMINRWVFRHGDIYQHFAERLSQINPNFYEIKNLDDNQSAEVLIGAPEKFGSLPVYLFAVLNGVALSATSLDILRQNAVKEEEQSRQKKETTGTRQASLEEMLEHQKNEILRLEKKYEEKLSGVVKKHAMDVEALKKQIRALQRK